VGLKAVFSTEIVPGLKALASATASGPTGLTTPEHGLWFDPDKLLVDPYAFQIDRPYRLRSQGLRRGAGSRGDTALADAEGSWFVKLPERVDVASRRVFERRAG
jgi:pullulanase/glycogen debranching enzyme